MSKGRTGLRIKYLKDGGYQNLADVFGASTMQIASVYGISQDAAYTIKNLCSNYAKNINSAVKLKLSSDDKSKSATKVVQAVYIYLKNSEYNKRIDELYREYGNFFTKGL